MKNKKPESKKMKRVNVTLDQETIRKAEEIAMGNVSMGIRIAIRDHKVKK